jgi:hypothetical protein
MKLRILDNSFRFRITLRELEILGGTGRIETAARFPPTGNREPSFSYAVSVDPEAPDSELRIDPFRIEFVLSRADLDRLRDPGTEGVYCRREWRDPAGDTVRAMAFLEKDRPATSCDKPEVWIYDHPHGSPRTDRGQGS